MNRLTQRKSYGIVINTKTVENFLASRSDKSALGQAMEKLASYEDAEEQGLLIKLPCKVGDAMYLIIKDELYGYKTIKSVTSQCFVWRLTYGFCVKVANIGENIPCRDIPLSEFGKTLFLTRESAEEALKGGDL